MRRKNGEILAWIWEHVPVNYRVCCAIGALFIIIVVAAVEILSYLIVK